MVNLQCAILSAALLFWPFAVCAKAENVILTARDDGLQISGTLLGFDGEFYRVETEYGEMTVDGSGVSCTGPACPDLENFVAELRFSGSVRMGAVLMPALVEAFAQKEGYTARREADGAGNGFVYLLNRRDDGALAARFIFRTGTMDEGFADLLANEADVVMASREIRPQERTRAREAGFGDMSAQNQSRVLALDAVVPLVSPANPVENVSPMMLAKIFAGEINNWADIGGPDAPISLHLPSKGSGLAQAIEDQVMRPVGLDLADGIVRHEMPAQLAKAVAADAFALGLSSHADQGNTVALALAGTCRATIAASRRMIKTEDYPLTAPMLLYFPQRRQPRIAREFLAFTRGPTAQIVIRRAGFVDQTPEEIPIGDQGSRFANAITFAGGETSLEELQRMTATLRPMARLSTSFRFDRGSARLDAQSRSNIRQLAHALEIGQYDARRLLFVGFSDGNGGGQANRDIALRRAEAVMHAVRQAAPAANFDRVILDVDAFGEAMPIACDDTPWDREANRRVEVWIR